MLEVTTAARLRALAVAMDWQSQWKRLVYKPKNIVLSALTLLALAAVSSGIAIAQTPSASQEQSPSASELLPSWAYPWAPAFVAAPADDVPQNLPSSSATVSWKQARDLFFAPDWHPDGHPPMPEVVASGRKPDVRACGSCHRTEGTGGPENAVLAGLPAAYFIRQIADFKSGARKFSGPPRSGSVIMTAAAKAMTDAEAQAAAAYFSAMKPKRIIKVVESETVPKTYIARLFYVKAAEGGTEPLGQRIIEMPDDVVQFELRDSRAQFTAYVPVGSVAKGEALAKTGGADVTVACGTCHGPDLKGLDTVPGIAGRSPSYIVRQLYDFQKGARAGETGILMKPTVEKLTQGDMISLAAYVASLAP